MVLGMREEGGGGEGAEEVGWGRRAEVIYSLYYVRTFLNLIWICSFCSCFSISNLSKIILILIILQFKTPVCQILVFMAPVQQQGHPPIRANVILDI